MYNHETQKNNIILGQKNEYNKYFVLYRYVYIDIDIYYTYLFYA